jgi:inorganic triphosphatase YgiF
MLAAPGRDFPVLDLFDAPLRSAAPGELVDRRALVSYRQRLAALDAEVDDADHDHDLERRSRAELERQVLLDEIAKVTGTAGRQRQFANHPAERARKAVTGRIRHTIRKLDPALPELAAHLQPTIVTDTYCRYRPDTIVWTIDTADRR